MATTIDTVRLPISGGCVCGGVRFVASAEPRRVTVCHCLWCQRRTGSAFGAEAVFGMDDVVVSGETLSRYRHRSDESGRWVEQTFCSRCGSNLGLTLEAAPGIRSIAVGAFDDPSSLQGGRCPIRHVFLRSAGDWVDVPDTVERFERHFRD